MSIDFFGPAIVQSLRSACLALALGACIGRPVPNPGTASGGPAAANAPAANGSPANAAAPTAAAPAASGAGSNAAGAPVAGSAAAPLETGPREFRHTAAELLGTLRLGWNLGNSLDVPEGETAWGNPKATPELFAAVAKNGFRVVRIPVTWSKHMGGAPGYVIDPAWLARVTEVVGYARSAGLVVVVNVHHDGADGFKGVQWITLKDARGKITAANDAGVRARFLTVWTQLAKNFADYGEELLFESMNEIHDGYGKPDPRYFTFINDLNQRFVDLIRASGANNAKRILIVPGYNTNIDQTLAGFTLPKDSAPNRLVLSVHYYDPYSFTIAAKTHTWGSASPGKDDWGQEDFVTSEFDKLKSTYIDHGVPVLLGEFGATEQTGFEDYRRYYLEYVTRAAAERGIVPVYWDNGGEGSGASKFGLIDRHGYGVLHPELMSALLRAATGSTGLDKISRPKPSH